MDKCGVNCIGFFQSCTFGRTQLFGNPRGNFAFRNGRGDGAPLACAAADTGRSRALEHVPQGRPAWIQEGIMKLISACSHEMAFGLARSWHKTATLVEKRLRK